MASCQEGKSKVFICAQATFRSYLLVLLATLIAPFVPAHAARGQCPAGWLPTPRQDDRIPAMHDRAPSRDVRSVHKNDHPSLWHELVG